MERTEAIILAETFDYVRKMTKHMGKYLKDVDKTRRVEANGITFNSPLWIMAHLTWAEHNILIVGVGGKPMDIPWLDKVSFGSKPDDQTGLPTYEEIIETMDKVHETAMNTVKALTDEELAQPNNAPGFGSATTKRTVIQHAIRHEPMHAGHLSWLAKLNGVKTF